MKRIELVYENTLFVSRTKIIYEYLIVKRGTIDNLYAIVYRKTDISTQLRGFMNSESIDLNTVLSLSETYGELDREIVYYYSTYFAQVCQSLSSEQ